MGESFLFDVLITVLFIFDAIQRSSHPIQSNPIRPRCYICIWHDILIFCYSAFAGAKTTSKTLPACPVAAEKAFFKSSSSCTKASNLSTEALDPAQVSQVASIAGVAASASTILLGKVRILAHTQKLNLPCLHYRWHPLFRRLHSVEIFALSNPALPSSPWKDSRPFCGRSPDGQVVVKFLLRGS